MAKTSSGGYECNDRIDNDGDGKTDYPKDPDCSSYYDNSESNPAPPNIPTITGPVTGSRGVTYSFTVQGTDPNGDLITYYFNWGDGTYGNTPQIVSGASYSMDHSWSSYGAKTVQVRACDGLCSGGMWTGGCTDRCSWPAAAHSINIPCPSGQCLFGDQCYASGACHPSNAVQKCSSGSWASSCGDSVCNCGETSGSCGGDCARDTIVYVTGSSHNSDFTESGTYASGRQGLDTFCIAQKPANLTCGNVHAMVSSQTAAVSWSGPFNDEVRDMPSNYGYNPNQPLFWFNSATAAYTQFASNWSDMFDGSITTSQYAGTGKSQDVWSGTRSDGSMGVWPLSDQVCDRCGELSVCNSWSMINWIYPDNTCSSQYKYGSKASATAVDSSWITVSPGSNQGTWCMYDSGFEANNFSYYPDGHGCAGNNLPIRCVCQLSADPCVPPAVGDWTIPSGVTCTITDKDHTIYGNLNIRGILELKGSSNLLFNGSPRYIYVYTSGKIYVDDTAGIGREPICRNYSCDSEYVEKICGANDAWCTTYVCNRRGLGSGHWTVDFYSTQWAYGCNNYCGGLSSYNACYTPGAVNSNWPCGHCECGDCP